MDGGDGCGGGKLGCGGSTQYICEDERERDEVRIKEWKPKMRASVVFGGCLGQKQWVPFLPSFTLYHNFHYSLSPLLILIFSLFIPYFYYLSLNNILTIFN